MTGEIDYFNCLSAVIRVSFINDESKQNVYIDNGKVLNYEFCNLVEVGDSLFEAVRDEYIHIIKNGKELKFAVFPEHQ